MLNFKTALAHASGVGFHVSRAHQGHLAVFRELALAECAAVRLQDLLTRRYPGSRTNQHLSALQFHTVISVCGAAATHPVKITSERVQEKPDLGDFEGNAPRILIVTER